MRAATGTVSMPKRAAEEEHATAIHEAGHAVIARVLGLVCDKVTINANYRTGSVSPERGEELLGHCNQIGLDLVLASLAPHDKPNARPRRIAERHRGGLGSDFTSLINLRNLCKSQLQ